MLFSGWVDGASGDEERRRFKYRVDGVEVSVINERVQYYGADGRLITESLKDYTRRNVRERFASLDDFLQRWNYAARKRAILAEMEAHGILFEAPQEEVGRDYDPFDLICHVAFDQPPLTRRQRAENVRRSDYFGEYGEQARKLLDALLDKYADEGVENIEEISVLKLNP